MQGDITSQLVDGADRFLLVADREVGGRPRPLLEAGLPFSREIPALARSPIGSVWPTSSACAILRVAFDALELLATTAQPALVGEGTGFRAYAVRWPAFADVHGEGLLLVPTGAKVADVIAMPDADQTPEMIAGLAAGRAAGVAVRPPIGRKRLPGAGSACWSIGR